MELYIIYKHTNIVNSKVYIGQTYKTILERWKDGYKFNMHFHSAIKKYGKQAFIHEVLCYGIGKNNTNYLEKHFIAEYDSTNPEKGYNKDLGGNSAGCHSEETKKKISAANKGKKRSQEFIDNAKEIYNNGGGQKLLDGKKDLQPSMLGKFHSEETKQKISNSHQGKQSPLKGKKTGKLPYNFGKKLSEETKHKISIAKSGKKLTGEHKQKLSDAGRNRKHSEETKQKMALAHTGKKHTEETKKKLSELRKGMTNE